jgi:hypothetical protein
LSFKKLDIELVEPPGRLDVDRIVRDLPDGRDARKRQEKAEMLGEFGIGAGDDLAGI